jgi:VIT1/CCC1 family predicted Fe2+/Mn2+ transporter
MYLMGCLAERARLLGSLRAVRSASDPQKGQSLIADALPPVVGTNLQAPELERIRQKLLQLPEPSDHPRLTKKDWVGASAVFLLVVLSTFPVVLPFMFMQHVMRAQRLSNGIAVAMLFLTGYAFGRCTGYHPRGMGIAMVILGSVLVGMTILLGG